MSLSAFSLNPVPTARRRNRLIQMITLCMGTSGSGPIFKMLWPGKSSCLAPFFRLAESPLLLTVEKIVRFSGQN
jgi:hypothetical protein